MMRKLAVTVFTLSLAALGCGSDSGTPPGPDTGVPAEAGAKTDVVVNPSLDTQVADAPVGPEVQVALDGPKLDVPVVVDSPSDQAQVVDQAPQIVDGPKPVDTQPAIDGPKPALDGGVDTQRVDSGAAVDAGGVDGGAAG